MGLPGDQGCDPSTLAGLRLVEEASILPKGTQTV